MNEQRKYKIYQLIDLKYLNDRLDNIFYFSSTPQKITLMTYKLGEKLLKINPKIRFYYFYEEKSKKFLRTKNELKYKILDPRYINPNSFLYDSKLSSDDKYKQIELSKLQIYEHINSNNVQFRRIRSNRNSSINSSEDPMNIYRI